jgi:hypothetical protein
VTRDVLARVLAAMLATDRLRRGTVTSLEVLHDPNCPRPRGGVCTCVEPELLLDGRPVVVPWG